jgi:hypothetical protein
MSPEWVARIEEKALFLTTPLLDGLSGEERINLVDANGGRALMKRLSSGEVQFLTALAAFRTVAELDFDHVDASLRAHLLDVLPPEQ